ncbi:peptidoglycan-binding protein [Wohlfahrtiimonas larvae]|uniref:Peptidoglycan binding-like domain-containing protein n=1 Tax=Wohlfahrtiimonas larvae TaxID=1157986 RepID=A0ABP9MPA6_9GAMM|nr:peptidoglycan-binding protein [Wohlfahrtiimonas larvae]
MNKYLKYGWLAIVIIIPAFLNFSKTEQDIFTVVSSSGLDGVKTEVQRSPKLLNTVDKHGFTMYDYAVLNDDENVQRWMVSQKIASGVSSQMIERIRLWFLLLGVPVNSKNFNLQGIYDKGLEEAILRYQTTRGLKPQKQITPDWYADLEEDGVRFLQGLLFDEDSEFITGIWDDASAKALKAFQSSENLPQTGHLSLADIVALKKSYANTIDIIQNRNKFVTKVSNVDIAEPEIKLVEDMEVSVPTTVIEPTKPAEEIKPKVEDDTKIEEPTKTEAMTAGFLIDSNATAGKLLNLQVWLTLAGFPAGTLDGQMGPSTRQAIKDFEVSIGLKPTGIMSAKWEAPLEKMIWKKVQEKLKHLELYDQGIDGIPGRSTVDALKSYEEVSGIQPIGSLLPETLSMLFNEGQMTNDVSIEDTQSVEIDHSEEDGIIEEEGDDEAIGTSVVASDESSVSTSSDELHVDDIVGSVASFNPDHGVEDTVQLQLMLAVLGYFKDEVDGKSSEALTESIKAFQADNGLGIDGKVGRQTNAKMNSQTITRIQRYLNDKGLLADAPTGTLGPKTRKIVMDLRKQYKLPESDPTQLDIGILLIVLGDVNKENYVQMYLDILEEQRILKEKTQKAQEYLTALGYFNGKIDGLQGKATNDSIEKFKKDHKLPINPDITDDLQNTLKKQTVKSVQEGLVKLGYKLKADGLTGPTTKKMIETFQKRYSHKVTGEPNLETLHQINARIVANTRRSPTVAKANTASNVANDQPIRGVMPTMGAKGAQSETILTAPPQAISGRMSMIYNSKGALAGCKVNNISISAAMCGGAKNNQQCRIVYRKGRVLSVSCRG